MQLGALLLDSLSTPFFLVSLAPWAKETDAKVKSKIKNMKSI